MLALPGCPYYYDISTRSRGRRTARVDQRMPTIIAQSERERLPRSLCYPIKFKDIERALQYLDAGEIYLLTYFDRRQHMWKEDRERAKQEGLFSFLSLTIERDPRPESHIGRICGRLSESTPMEVGTIAHISTIERTVMKESGLSQSYVGDALAAEMRQVEEKGRLTGDCVIEIVLDVNERCLRAKRVYRREYLVERTVEAVYK